MNTGPGFISKRVQVVSLLNSGLDLHCPQKVGKLRLAAKGWISEEMYFFKNWKKKTGYGGTGSIVALRVNEDKYGVCSTYDDSER